MPPLNEPRIEAVLFDLGGVLMNFGGIGRLAALTGEAETASLQQRFAQDPSLGALERGRCSPQEFATGFVHDWGLELTPTEFLAEFSSWPAGPFDGTRALVAQVHERVRIGCLSNTNPVHWQQHLDRWGVVDDFEWRFVSHEIGAMKPDPAVYEHAIRTVDLAPDRILFLDDSPGHVAAAVSHGLRAVHTVGLDAVRAALATHLPGFAN